MRRYRIVFAIVPLLLIVSAAAGQEKPLSTPQPAAAPPPRSAVNVRIDISIVEQLSGEAAQPKTIAVIVADGARVHIRAGFGDQGINVDTRTMMFDGRIRQELTVASLHKPVPAHNWNHAFSLLLENGKPVVAFESVDTATKQRLAIEVKATILK